MGVLLHEKQTRVNFLLSILQILYFSYIFYTKSLEVIYCVRIQRLHMYKTEKDMLQTVPSVLKPELPSSPSLSNWQLNPLLFQFDFDAVGITKVILNI